MPPSRWSEAPRPPHREEPRRPRTIILNPGGTGSNGTGPSPAVTGDGPGRPSGASGPGNQSGSAGGDEEALVTAERPALPRPTAPPSNGIDLRADPFAALDREMARSIAAKLAEALTRYATPALVPLVVDQMAEILEVDKPRVTRTGKDSTPPT